MLQQIVVKNKQYTIKERPIQNLVTEFFGKITKQTTTLTEIDFEDLVVVHEGDTTEILDGKILADQFEMALSSFKKPAKT